jgi:hypothetical protein
MPQGPAHLHEKFKDDAGAWKILQQVGYTDDRGMIIPPDDEYRPTEEEKEAIDYLVLEWDYGWDYSNG